MDNISIINQTLAWEKKLEIERQERELRQYQAERIPPENPEPQTEIRESFLARFFGRRSPRREPLCECM